MRPQRFTSRYNMPLPQRPSANRTLNSQTWICPPSSNRFPELNWPLVTVNCVNRLSSAALYLLRRCSDGRANEAWSRPRSCTCRCSGTRTQSGLRSPGWSPYWTRNNLRFRNKRTRNLWDSSQNVKRSGVHRGDETNACRSWRKTSSCSLNEFRFRCVFPRLAVNAPQR